MRNRIVEYRVVHPDEVARNPRNWRMHPTRQRRALRAVLDRIGIAGAVICYYSARNDGKLTLIDGHERMTLNVPFPALILDVSDDEADALLASYDPLGDLAIGDDHALAALIADVTHSDPTLGAVLSAFDATLDDVASIARKDAHLLRSGPRGHGYDFALDTLKLAHRLEAVAHCRQRRSALELYAGQGLLSYWYLRLFDQVVRIDINHEYAPDIVSDAEQWLEQSFDPRTMQFDMVDFDPSGCPSRALQRFFARIAGVWTHQFVLCLTDGSGLNLKSRGKASLQETYLIGANDIQQTTTTLYERFLDLVDHHLVTLCERHGFIARQISLVRGERGHVAYGCYVIDAAECASDCGSQAGDTVEDRA